MELYKKYLIKVAYLGEYFCGSQVQPEVKTVEGEIKKVLKELGYKSKTEFSSRTDKGVSAIGNTFCMYSIEPPNLQAITHNLENIFLWAYVEVDLNFMPRWASMRHYRYILVDDSIKSIREMKKHAKLFIGKHNFSNFCKGFQKNPFRKIYDIKIRKKHNVIIFDIYGRNFLRQMIRKIVSYLIKVQTENIDLEYTRQLLTCEIQEWIPPAPPEGLILIDVIYKGIKFQECPEVKKFAHDIMKTKINNLLLKNELYKNFVKTFKP